MMFLQKFLLLILLSQASFANHYEDSADNEFAEFEDFDVEDELSVHEDLSAASRQPDPTPESDDLENDDQEMVIDDDDSEFEHFQDVEEFEGFEDNFSLVGDDGSLDRNENVSLVKESENVFTLWCSGRTCCEGMLVELKLIKRQDLLAVLSGIMRPTMDQIQITIKMNKEDMDSFVFCLATKKTATQLVKEMADLSVYCPERKSGEKYNLLPGFNVMSEISEAGLAILDSKITAVLNRYPEYIDYIHISDQFSGPKQTEENALKLPDTEKVLMFGFNIPVKGMSLEEACIKLSPVMTMVFYCLDKIKRFRLSKEAKAKADKNRQKVEEAFLKSTHQARAEAAAAKREEKRRQEKEKILAEEDPDRQRRWELKEEKRQAKKRGPKMKQLKVKAL
ncbi:hypothetical protein JTB14_006093 [Gonioctena quinquepunctata]|nr:hypothetical protein JTB14_006093 [Gonioctena quinquepunctata]